MYLHEKGSFINGLQGILNFHPLECCPVYCPHGHSSVGGSASHLSLTPFPSCIANAHSMSIMDSLPHAPILGNYSSVLSSPREPLHQLLTQLRLHYQAAPESFPGTCLVEFSCPPSPLSESQLHLVLTCDVPLLLQGTTPRFILPHLATESEPWRASLAFQGCLTLFRL